jgi:hypothetical protein
MCEFKGTQETGLRYLASYCIHIPPKRLAEMTYLFSCSSVVEHCAYEVTLASQWSAVQTCPGESFLGEVASIVCSVIPLYTNAAFSLPLSREMRVSGGAIYAIYIHTYTRGTAIAHNTHSYGRMLANWSYRSCIADLPQTTEENHRCIA